MARAAPSVYAQLAAREIALGNGSKLATKAAPRGLVPRTLDRIAGAISPAWLAGRKQARMESAIATGSYNVTVPSRTRRTAPYVGGSADNSQLDRTLWTLREICRDHYRNNSLFSGLIDRWTENVAGPEWGFRPDSGDPAFDADAADALAAMAPVAEHRGLFNLQDVIATTTQAVCTDGDQLIVPLADGRLQMVEAHDLVGPLSGYGYADRRVIGGVELGDDGNHLAYYVRDPNDNQPYTVQSYWIDDYKKAQRVPAERAIFPANRRRYSQTRGVPIPASCLDQFESYDSYLDSEQLAARLTADLAYVVRRSSKDGTPWPGQETQDDANATSRSVKTFEALVRHEPGQVIQLALDEQIDMLSPQRPGNTFEPYTRVILRMVGCGMGMPLELVLLDFSQTNYSSARAALLQAYRAFLRWQRFVRDHIIQPIYNAWMSRWIARRDLRPVAGAYKLRYFPPRWAWVDPLKEVLALEKRIAMCGGTLEEMAAAEGHPLEELVAARKRELDALRTDRIPTTTAPANLYPNQTVQPGGNEPAKADAAKAAADAALIQSVLDEGDREENR